MATSIAASAPAGQTQGGLYDRPSALTEWQWKPLLEKVDAQQAFRDHQQRHTTARFYTEDSGLGTRTFFIEQHRPRRANVVLMMETTLGVEYHGEDRCQKCIDRNIACVRYVERANTQISKCGSACVYCRAFLSACSKSNERQSRRSIKLNNEPSGRRDSNTQ